jgi:hypothetical protein
MLDDFVGNIMKSLVLASSPISRQLSGISLKPVKCDKKTKKNKALPNKLEKALKICTIGD